MSDKVAVYRERVEEALDDLLRGLKPGAKVAFIMWVPGSNETEMVITNGRAEDLPAVIERSLKREGT